MNLTWRLAALVISLTSMVTAHAANAASSALPVRPELIFVTLGTRGGPIVAVNRSEPANAVIVGGSIYLFDVGDGVQRQMAAAKLDLANLRAIFISHHHIDHNGGLAPLLVTRWVLAEDAKLPVLGPPGTVAMVTGILTSYRPTELAPVATGVRETSLGLTTAPVDLPPDLDEPRLIYRDENVRVLAITNDHFHFAPGSREQRFSRSYSFRIEGAGRTVVYTGDTGPSPNLVRLAKGADLLVSEVIDTKRMIASMTDPQAPPDPRLSGLIAHMEHDHLNPVAVGKIASAAGVKSVVLTHLVPGDDGETDLSGYTQGISPTFKGPVRIARDLDRY